MSKAERRALATAVLLLGLPQLTGGAGLAQIADSTRQAATADSALVQRLREELDWRRLIRVRTPEAWVQLERPSVSPRGIDYEGLSLMKGPASGAPPPRPIPLPAVLMVEARQGNLKAGMIWGGVVGVGFFAFVAQALYRTDGGDGDLGDSLRVGILLGAPVGALFGAVLGEAMYTWQPVYVAGGADSEGPR